MRPKSFVIIFITYVYTIDIPTMGSHRDNMFRVYVIHSNCARLHNFFLFMMDYGENDYYTQKCEQKWLENNNRWGGGGDGIKMSWMEKNRKINNRGGDDYLGLESGLNWLFTIVFLTQILVSGWK